MTADIAIAIGIDSGPAKIGADQYLAQLKRIGDATEVEAKRIRDTLAGIYGGAGSPSPIPVPPQSSPSSIPPASPQSRPSTPRAPDAEKEIRALTAAYAPYTAQLNKLAADETRLKELRQEALDKGKDGAKDAALYGDMLDKLAHRQRIVTHEQQRMAAGAKLNAQEMRNLSYQINDVVSGLAMGQSPMQILTQQGGQFFQIFQAAGISVSAMAGGLLALAAAAATATAAVISNNNSMREVAKSAALTGHNIGIATSDMEDMAVKYAKASDLSVREARNIEVAVMKAGVNSKQALDTIATSARGVANALTDGDLQSATDLLTQAFMDPQKAAKQLDSTLNILTASQIRQIEVLTARNDKEGAFKVLMDALQPRLKDHTDQVWSLSKAWASATDAISEFWTHTGKAFGDGGSLSEQIDRLNQEISDLDMMNPGNSRSDILRQRVADLEKQLAQQRMASSIAGQEAAYRTATKPGEKIAEKLTPGFSDLDALKQQRENVAKSIDAMSAAAMDGEKTNDALNASMSRQVPVLQALDTAIKSYKTEGEKSNAMAQAQMAASRMSSADAQKYLAVKQAELSLSGKATTQAEIDLIKKSANLQVTAQQNAATTRTIEQIKEQTAAQNNLNKAIGQGWEAQQQANIANQIGAAKAKDPSMSSARLKELEDALKKKKDEDQAKITGEYADQASRAIQLENRLADARMRGSKATNEASLELEVERLKLAGVNEETARKLVLENQLAQQRSQNLDLAKSMNPALVYNQEMEALAQLKASKEGALVTSEQYAQKEIELKIRMLEANRDFASGAQAALMRYANDSQNYGAMAARGVDSVAYAMEDFSVTMVTKSKSASEAFKNMASSIIQDIARMTAKATITGPLSGMLSGLLTKGLGSLFGGNTSSIAAEQAYSSSPAFLASVGLHSGGMAGTDATFTRSVPAISFANAQRFHNGGLPGIKSNEVPTILQKGEEVLTANDPRHIGNLGRVPANQNMGGNTNQAINISEGAIVVNAPGASHADAQAIAAEVAMKIVQMAAPRIAREGARMGVQNVRALSGKDAAFAKSVRGR